METYPLPPQQTNAEVIDIDELRKRREASEIAGGVDGLPTREQAGANVIDITDRLDARTIRVTGETTGQIRDVTAHTENFTDQDSGVVKDLGRTTREIEAGANEKLEQLGLKSRAATEDIRSEVIATSNDEDVRGLNSKMTEKREDDLITDEAEQGVEDHIVLETVKQEIDKGAEVYSLSEHAKKKLGGMSVVQVVALDRVGVGRLTDEINQPGQDDIVGVSQDGEEQRFVHSTESGPFLMNVLNGRTAEAMKSLTEDGKEQLAARIEDYEDKYGTKDLSKVSLEVRDLERLERIFLKNNKDIGIAQRYEDKQYEVAA